MTVTSPGKILLSGILPDKYKELDAPLDSKGVKTLFTRMANELPREEYVQTLRKLNQFGNNVTTTYGGVASIHLRDIRIPEELGRHRDKLSKKLNSIVQDPRLTSADKKKMILQATNEATKDIDKEVLNVLGNRENSFGLLVKTGIRGKPAQLRQLVYGDLLTLDSKNRTIPYPTLRSYGEGVSPLQYWTASHGGRQGYYLVQKATADAGYFSKQVRGTVHRQVITSEDCGKAKGYVVGGDDPDNVGSLLFQDTKGESGKVYKANTPITNEMLSDLPKKIQIRSAVTCGQREGACSMCSGIRETGKLPDIGDAVGLNGVNSFLERLNQGAVSSKHVGGEAVSAKRIKHGFDAVEQFINTPEDFVGGAVLADKDGTVSGIIPAPQGGSFIRIGDHNVYAPADAEIKVKRGDTVEAGDVLTDGMPNIGKITEYKGIGTGRKMFVDAFNKLLRDEGTGTMRKHIETFARGYVSRVEITDPDGLQGWIYGDIADYNAIESKWKPREGTVTKDVRKALNSYLEEPVLHYSIGTRITPSVVKDLEESGYRTINVNEKEPPFRPYMTSAKQFQPADEDWITALSGENLTKSLLNHAQRGADSEKHSVSMYPRLALSSGNYPKPLTFE